MVYLPGSNAPLHTTSSLVKSPDHDATTVKLSLLIATLRLALSSEVLENLVVNSAGMGSSFPNTEEMSISRWV